MAIIVDRSQRVDSVQTKILPHPSMPPLLSRLIEQLHQLETQIPVQRGSRKRQSHLLAQPSTPQPPTNFSLMQGYCANILYTEKVENSTRLLALADSCIGQIRSQMRTHGIPIHLPSSCPNPVTITDPDTVSDASAAAIPGK
ncbi:hypothetical protein BJ322DRAFT_1022911 [Thelephora terrestris]|uniref:Uncharacterized protein n=1 Tax=Thelephora terrestris TaxID=56493 RepID=A0A9P6HB03_9AGAM|nr:hypothetical protein BJ322DRAFT_1022911 [Thelephora terrestris]